MNAEAALELVEQALGEERLSKLQIVVFRQTWAELSYQEIARDSGYEVGYIKQTGSQLWQALSHAFGEKVRKGNVHVVLRRYASRRQKAVEEGMGYGLKGTEEGTGYKVQGTSNSELFLSHPPSSLIPHPSSFSPQYSASIQNSPPHPTPLTDWGEAPDVSIFYGRTEELATLERWVINDRCRLVGLFGMGGIGKTALSVKLAQQVSGRRDEGGGMRDESSLTEPRNENESIKNESFDSSLIPHPSSFQFVIWRSLRNAPPIHDLLADLILFLSGQREAGLPDRLDRRILRLLEYLRSFRCLLILDNAETVMQAGDRDGSYQPGYEGYGQLLRCVGEADHQSCLLLTSREKPKGFAPREGDVLPVRSLPVSGLNPMIGQELFQVKGTFSGSTADWQTLIAHYAGNPLALKIVATAIADFFDGSIAQFLEFTRQGNSVFGDIRDLLARQIGRLSNLEQQVMVWLAINREPIKFAELQTDCVPTVSPAHLLETLIALERRSLIEKSGSRFTLQPAVMEYLTDWLIEQVCEEVGDGRWAMGDGQTETDGETRGRGDTENLIQNSKFKIQNSLPCLRSHALIKAQAQDYIRETQIRLILQPLADRLLQAYSRAEVDHRLMQILAAVRGKAAQEAGYVGGNVINLLCQLQVDLSDRDFSQLTLWQVYLRAVTLHGTNLAHSDLTKSVFTETFSQILNVAFSPDGTLLAASDISYEVHVWRVSDGKKLLTGKASDGWAWSIAFSPDSSLLASSANGTIHLWDMQTGACLQTIRGYTSRVFSLAFSPDGCLLASGNEDHQIRIWDVATGELVAVLTGHTDEVHSVAFSPNGHLLASGSYDRTIKLWQVAEEDAGTQRHGDAGTSIQNSKFKIQNSNLSSSLIPHPSSLSGHTHWVWSVAFSPDGTTLVSSSSDRTLKLWDVQTGHCIKTLTGHTQPIRSVAFISPSLKAEEEGTGYGVRGTDHSKLSPTPHTPHPTPFLVSGSDDHTVRLWNSEGDCLRVLQGHTSWISAVAVSPDGCLLASGSEDQSVRLWDSHTNHCLRVLQGYNSGVWSVAFSPDGKTLVSGGQDRMVRLWDVENSIQNSKFKIQNSSSPLTLSGHTSWIWSVAVSSDGEAIASGSEDGTIRLWNISELGKQGTGKEGTGYGVQGIDDSKFPFSPHPSSLIPHPSSLIPLSGHTHAVWSVAFSPNGSLLASGSLDGTVRLWDRFTGQCQQVLQQHQSGVWSVAFAPKGEAGEGDRQLLASGSQDQTICLWEISSPTASSDGISEQSAELCVRSLKTLAGHISWIRCIVFSPNGKLLASASSDGSVKLWQIETGECLRTFQAHSSLVLALAFSPDGQTLATGGGDATIKLWDISTPGPPSPSPRFTLEGHHKWVRSLAFSPTGDTLASCSQDGSVKLWALNHQNISNRATDVFCLATLRIYRPYEAANITRVTGLTAAQTETLKILGAIAE